MIYVQFRLGYGNFNNITKRDESIVKSLFVDMIVKTTNEDRRFLPRLVRHRKSFQDDQGAIKARKRSCIKTPTSITCQMPRSSEVKETKFRVRNWMYFLRECNCQLSLSPNTNNACSFQTSDRHSFPTVSTSVLHAACHSAVNLHA